MRSILRIVFVFLTLLVSPALAQSRYRMATSVPSNAVTQTTAAMTLYVDPIGSDSNACVASGTAACLTFGAALNKIPSHIRHLVTVNVATGTYTEVFRIQGFHLEGVNGAASTAALTITGTQVAFSVATGTNTGTVTSYVNNSTVDGSHAVLNDTTQTWTTNNLRGRYVFITSGPGNGEYHLVASNTATQLVLAYRFTTPPTSSSTYEIRTPGPVFTGSQGVVRGATGAGVITISDISLQPSSGSAFTAASALAPLTTTRVRFVGVSSGIQNSATPPNGASSWSMNQVYVTAGTGSGVAVANDSRITATELYVQCTGTCAGTGLLNGTRNSTISSWSGTVAGPFATAMISAAGPVGIQSTGLWIDGTGTEIGILLSAANDSNARFVGSGWSQNTGPYMSNLSVGYSLNNVSTSYVDNGSVFVSNTTTAILLTGGARAIIEAGTNLSGVTNFISIDGTIYSDADLTTFTRITGPQGSYATRP